MPWGTYASGLVTHAIKKNRIEELCKTANRVLSGSAGKMRGRYMNRRKWSKACWPKTRGRSTCGTAAWSDCLTSLRHRDPILILACRKHDIDTSQVGYGSASGPLQAFQFARGTATAVSH